MSERTLRPAATAPLHVQEGWSTDWFCWFAWRPVRLSERVYEPDDFSYLPNGRWAWLRWVERRVFFAAPWFCVRGWTEFRIPPPRDMEAVR
jgi:hypothetical protein